MLFYFFITVTLWAKEPTYTVFNVESKASLLDRTVRFGIPDKKQMEICEIPKPFMGKYTDADRKGLAALCDLDLHGTDITPYTTDKILVATCPKTVSSNPGIDIYRLPKNNTREAIENNDCKNAKKIAKFKQSISCSYTPSILAYFHVSRILGLSQMVPVSVYRTVDPGYHERIVEKGIQLTDPEDIIHLNWRTYKSRKRQNKKSLEKDPSRRAKLIRRLYTHKNSSPNKLDDDPLLAGALMANPRGENTFRGGLAGYSKKNERAGRPMRRIEIFLQTNFVNYTLANPLSTLEFIPKRTSSKQSQIQTLVLLRDFSAMLILDYILSQGDRFGNQHFFLYHYYLDQNNQLQRVLATDYMADVERNMLISHGSSLFDKEVQQIFPNIKVMLLKDNDCGVTGYNFAKLYKAIDKIRHMDYDLYRKMLDLNNVYDQPRSKEFFHNVVKFSSADYKKVGANLKRVSAQLKSKCQKGTLKFDLSLPHFLAQKAYEHSDYPCAE